MNRNMNRNMKTTCVNLDAKLLQSKDSYEDEYQDHFNSNSNSKEGKKQKGKDHCDGNDVSHEHEHHQDQSIDIDNDNNNENDNAIDLSRASSSSSSSSSSLSSLSSLRLRSRTIERIAVIIPPNTIHLQYMPHSLSSSACESLIRSSESIGYSRSLMKNGLEKSFISDKQTSYMSEQNQQSLLKLECVQPLVQLIRRLSGLDANHKVEAVIIRYRSQQAFGLHYDSLPHFKQPWKATLMVYLSDVEQGGETEFPRIPLKIKPKRGVAVYWENLALEKPPAAVKYVQLVDSQHQGLPIIKGEKYILNRQLKNMHRNELQLNVNYLILS